MEFILNILNLTPLVFAVYKNYVEIVQLLLSKPGIKFNDKCILKFKIFS